MPIYEYQVSDSAASEGKGCESCARPFEVLQKISDLPLDKCPRCGAPVARQISAPNVGSSRSMLDDRAKSAGFTKYQKLGKGEYEKKY